MIKIRSLLFYFLVLSPFIASAGTFSASDLSLKGSSGSKTFKYRGSSGALDLVWNGNTIAVKKLARGSEFLTSGQKPRTWGNELKQDKLKFADDILKDIEQVNGSLNKSMDEKNRIATKLNTVRMNQKPGEDASGDVEGLNSELKEINREISELKSRVHSLEYQRKKLGELDVYNTLAAISIRPSGSFFIKTTKGLYLSEGVTSADKLTNPLTGAQVYGKSWTAKSSNVLRSGSARPESHSNKLINLEVIDRGVTAISLNSGEQYDLKRIYNGNVQKYEQLERQHPVVVSKFAFKNDKLFLKYAQKKKSGSDVLNIDMKYTGKKKNLIQVFTKSPIRIVDPENKSGATTSHIGILGAGKKRLVQLKKQERVQGRIDSEWVHKYKKGLIKLGSTLHSVEGVDYYGWESLWYMASWMHITRASNKKINLITGQSVNGFSVKRTNDSKYGGSKVVISRAGASVYEFSTDNKGFVRQYRFVPYEQTLQVQAIETTTTRNNKRLLSEFANKHGLIEIKG